MADLTKEKETAFGWIDGNSERIAVVRLPS